MGSASSIDRSIVRIRIQIGNDGSVGMISGGSAGQRVSVLVLQASGPSKHLEQMWQSQRMKSEMRDWAQKQV